MSTGLHAMLPVANRSNERAVFRRRATLHMGERYALVHTVDISHNSISVLTPFPLPPRSPVSLSLNVILDNKLTALHLSGTSTSCVLAGINGFRIALQLTLSPAMQKHFEMLPGARLRS